ncbi:MAG: PaaI family thioesterase [Thermodesulfobacteriota bacterium]
MAKDQVENPMDPDIKSAIYEAVEKEPLAQTFHMALVEIDRGYSMVKMAYQPEQMANIYQRAHGGAIYCLIDEAFETASQTHGTIAVALNVNVTYVASPDTEILLFAEAREVSRSRKIANYDIKVNDEDHQLIATCQAVAYRTEKPIPFL